MKNVWQAIGGKQNCYLDRNDRQTDMPLELQGLMHNNVRKENYNQKSKEKENVIISKIIKLVILTNYL